MMRPARAALDLAHRGLAVFPLRHIIRRDDGGGFICSCGSANCRRDAGKHPHPNLAPSGFKNATTDIAKVEWWWDAVPDANIGIATGEIVVIDVDPRHGGDETFQQIEPKLPLTWRVQTGGGGQHLYFHAGNHEIKNSAGKIGPGIDVRGTGGYVVGVGSNHISGGIYSWDVDAHPDGAPLAPLPDWLITRKRPEPSISEMARATIRPPVAGSSGCYGAAALASEIAILAATAPGGRNGQLNRSTFALFQLVAGGELDDQGIADALIDACHQNGLVEDKGLRSVHATIASGARAGLQNPRKRKGRAAA
jgi:hypothetical protein